MMAGSPLRSDTPLTFSRLSRLSRVSRSHVLSYSLTVLLSYTLTYTYVSIRKTNG